MIAAITRRSRSEATTIATRITTGRVNSQPAALHDQGELQAGAGERQQQPPQQPGQLPPGGQQRRHQGIDREQRRRRVEVSGGRRETTLDHEPGNAIVRGQPEQQHDPDDADAEGERGEHDAGLRGWSTAAPGGARTPSDRAASCCARERVAGRVRPRDREVRPGRVEANRPSASRAGPAEPQPRAPERQRPWRRGRQAPPARPSTRSPGHSRRCARPRRSSGRPLPALGSLPERAASAALGDHRAARGSSRPIIAISGDGGDRPAPTQPASREHISAASVRAVQAPNWTSGRVSASRLVHFREGTDK